MKKALFISTCCIIIQIMGTPASALAGFLQPEVMVRDDPSTVINRPANVQGLTGLIFTNSAYTQPKGSVVTGLATIADNSRQPDYSMVQGIATVTAGITDRIEVGLRAQMIATNLGSSATRETGAGDTDLLIKWRISSQDRDLPAVAIGLAFTLPTGDEDQGLRSVEDQSIRVMVIGTSEQEMPGDSFIGIYFEGQLVQSDRLPGAEAKPYSDKYGVLNAGLLFPLNDSRSLQAIFEYSGVFKKDIPSVYEQDHSSVMPGLRYVTERFNLSLGVQLYNPDDPGIRNHPRYMGTLSYAF